MPKDESLQKILLIGSGPIVIGQGCEFDYSGTQACKALREEGYEVILVNSNPATIMTDPEFAERTYIEPITPEVIKKIIEKERPDALLPTVGGQTALNAAMDLWHSGVLEELEVRMIGANADAIAKGEDRLLFKEAMLKIGLDLPKSGVVHTMEDARRVAEEVGSLPLVIRPAYTLGGSGGGIAYNKEEFESIVARGLDLSPATEVLIEESLLGWKEFEMEVMRDCADNCVLICSIENLDPMGVHTGESVVVAPHQTLSDRDHQGLRNAALRLIRRLNIKGGCNVQFAVDQATGDFRVIEVNPRVSRSSALASKATGYPIARMAALIAVGYNLDELPNPITGEGTTAAFEPTMDYCVVKIPRWPFDKFRTADRTIGTSMKSTGEVMAIGRCFEEAFLKAYRALPRFRGESAFYTWLYRIAVNTAKNYLAAQRRRPMDVELDLQDPEQYDLHAKLRETDTPEGVTLSQELHETVERAINGLPDDLRTAIILRELDGMSYEEIAQTMDCPVGTVRSRIFRARDAIGKKIGTLID